MDDREYHLPHDFNTLGYLAAADVAVPVGLTGFIELFTKNAPEGFGIYRFTSTGEVLPQCIVDECLITAASFLGFDPESINNIIIQMYGDTCFTPGLDHRTTFALAKIVFLFHKLFAQLCLLFVRKSTELWCSGTYRQQRLSVPTNQAQ